MFSTVLENQVLTPTNILTPSFRETHVCIANMENMEDKNIAEHFI